MSEKEELWTLQSDRLGCARSTRDVVKISKTNQEFDTSLSLWREETFIAKPSHCDTVALSDIGQRNGYSYIINQVSLILTASQSLVSLIIMIYLRHLEI